MRSPYLPRNNTEKSEKDFQVSHYWWTGATKKKSLTTHLWEEKARGARKL